MSNNTSNRIEVPNARQAMNNLKYEVANELGITLNQGYNGHIGGQMVKKMIAAQERQMSNR